MTFGMNRVEKDFAMALFPETKVVRRHTKKKNRKSRSSGVGEAVHRTMLQSWNEKEALLHSAYRTPVDPVAYMEALFHGQDHPRACVWTSEKKGKKTHWYTSSEQMLDEVKNRHDAAVCPAEFFYMIRKTSVLKSLHALTLDLDGVEPADLRELINTNFMGVVPTYVINSGGGLHLVYLFTTPVDCYNWTKDLLTEVHTRLKSLFSVPWATYHVDTLPSLVQVYRVVGSKTKLGQVASAYLVGTMWFASGLAAAVDVAWEKPEAKPRTWQQDTKKVTTLPTGRPSFYQSVLEGIAEKTDVGHRHMAMFALAVVATKCRISNERLHHDLKDLQQKFNRSVPHGHTISDHEIENVVDTLDHKKAKLVKGETLEGWLGWKFERKTKRNYRTREEHLNLVAAQKRACSMEKVTNYLLEHPTASISEIAKSLGMSRNTVAKYYRKSPVQETEITTVDAVAASTVEAVPDPREIASLVTAILDPATSSVERQSLLERLPASYREAVQAWFSAGLVDGG